MAWRVNTKSDNGGASSARFNDEKSAREYAEGMLGQPSHWARDEKGQWTIPSGRYISVEVVETSEPTVPVEREEV